ncbi:MAG TPA: hypothetical protein VHN98_05955 [Acidimicrobiales bacterium]|nr:hypothetical protein [Acidimicrobiales bacterium]
MHGLLAALTWDPQIRGALIVITAVTILMGSVYLLLATNTGARLGFLLAACGLTGWLAVMGWVWVVYGIGIKGQEPHWVVKEVITGKIADQTTLDVTGNFPNGWKQLKPGDPVLGDASATADKVLAPATGTPAPGTEAAAPAFAPVFKATTDYTFVRAYEKGGDDYFIPGGYVHRTTTPFKGWLHSAHYAVVEVAPIIAAPSITGAPPRPTPDPAKPVTSVVMIRDLGDLRYPSMLFAIANSLLFALVLWQLHRRDKIVMSARAAAAAG